MGLGAADGGAADAVPRQLGQLPPLYVADVVAQDDMRSASVPSLPHRMTSSMSQCPPPLNARSLFLPMDAQDDDLHSPSFPPLSPPIG